MIILVHYRVTEPPLRRRLKRLLDSYGRQLQSGLYEFFLPARHYRSLMRALRDIKLGEADELRIYSLCRKCQNRALYCGAAKPNIPPPFWII
jgi:CRISPR-associated endonuclease Cas2